MANAGAAESYAPPRQDLLQSASEAKTRAFFSEYLVGSKRRLVANGDCVGSNKASSTHQATSLYDGSATAGAMRRAAQPMMRKYRLRTDEAERSQSILMAIWAGARRGR